MEKRPWWSHPGRCSRRTIRCSSAPTNCHDGRRWCWGGHHWRCGGRLRRCDVGSLWATRAPESVSRRRHWWLRSASNRIERWIWISGCSAVESVEFDEQSSVNPVSINHESSGAHNVKHTLAEMNMKYIWRKTNTACSTGLMPRRMKWQGESLGISRKAPNSNPS